MSYTKDVSCTNDWSTLITGQTSGFVQLKTYGPVLITVAQTTPDAGSFEGVVLFGNELRELGFSALESGDEVYGRSLDPGEVNKVAVMAPGAAPV